MAIYATREQTEFAHRAADRQLRELALLQYALENENARQDATLTATELRLEVEIRQHLLAGRHWSGLLSIMADAHRLQSHTGRGPLNLQRPEVFELIASLARRPQEPAEHGGGGC